MFDLVLTVLWIAALVVAACVGVASFFVNRSFAKRTWYVIADGVDYGAVTALEFEHHLFGETEVSFVSLETGFVHRVFYSELSYCELQPGENVNVEAFAAEEQEQQDADI